MGFIQFVCRKNQNRHDLFLGLRVASLGLVAVLFVSCSEVKSVYNIEDSHLFSEPTASVTPTISPSSVPSASPSSCSGLLCGWGSDTSGCSLPPQSFSSFECASAIVPNVGQQRLVPVRSTCAAQSMGYSEYVPANYNDHCNWPLIIYLHGDGALGDGTNTTVLSTLLYEGLPWQISIDQWDTQHRFVVLAPQMTSGMRTAANVKSFIQFALANYKIDPHRIYLASVSGGGSPLYKYLNAYAGDAIAGIVPVSSVTGTITSTAFCSWKSVPVWLFNGDADTNVRPSGALSVADTLKACLPAPTVQPKVTLYTNIGHEAAIFKTFGPSAMNLGIDTTFSNHTLDPFGNVYDWLLQFHR